MSISEQLPIISSIGRALPQNCYPQEAISAALWREWGNDDDGRARFERLHRSVGVRTRHLALPMEDYRALDSFSKTNDKWIERATELGMEATQSALTQAGLTAESIETKSTVTLDKDGDGFSITACHLDVKAKVPGADKATFEKLANAAKEGCPVSKLFAGNAKITLNTEFVS